jgi:hypothetical protein
MSGNFQTDKVGIPLARRQSSLSHSGVDNFEATPKKVSVVVCEGCKRTILATFFRPWGQKRRSKPGVGAKPASTNRSGQ